jgi:hypothetical protein
MTDKDVERVARALGRSVDSFADLDAVTLDQETLLIRGEGAKEWERFIPEARAMIAAHESAVAYIVRRSLCADRLSEPRRCRADVCGAY